MRLKQRLNEIKLNLGWIERLDLVNDLAPMAPELSMQLEKHQQKRANLFAGNAKLKSFTPQEDPVLNDFRREMIFHRQAQAAVVEGIKKLHQLNVPTKRPDDYFAEMAKSDEHMQKVRSNLMAKQQGQAKSERIKQIREQRKMGKLMQRQARVQRDTEKRDMLDKIKKYRKGKLKNLDFLDDDKKGGNRGGNTKSSGDKRKMRDQRFGFGGKKRGLKKNTKESSMDTGGSKPFKNAGGRGGKKGANPRPGKSKRVKANAKNKGRK